jgi:diguanylate cyclase
LGDEAGRYGGEEFSIALTESGLAQAKEIAQRLLEAIRNIRIELPGKGELKITASIGVAQWDGQESIQLFIERADKALYRAKHNGRDRIELHNDG